MSGHGIEYRDYQSEAKEAAFTAFEDGTDSALIVMPTGTGKTVLAGMCIEEAISCGVRCLFIAHREILINQAFKTFSAFGFECAVEMGQRNAMVHAANFGMPDVVVGSVQTLQDDRLMRWSPNSFGLIILDECHRSLADSYTKTLNWFEGYNLLGITATPKRGDEKNLGSRFKVKAYEYTLRRAIAEQWLSPIRIRKCPIPVDLKGIKMHGGDLAIGDLEHRIGPKIEQLARGFVREVGQRPAVVFTPDVGSAMAFAQVCTDLGMPARYVAGQGGRFGMPKAEREANLQAFNDGEFQAVVCCELLIEGWDCPKVEAVCIVRPTKQQYRYTQMVGRGTRLSPSTGKTDCLVIDFDWQTDEESKDLCSSVDLFNDGSINEDVFAVARGLLNERAVDADPADVVEEAEQIIKTRSKFRISLSGREAEYAAMEYDPVGVSKLLDIKLNRKYDLDKRGTNPATSAQLGLLQRLGVTTPESLSKWGASKMIDKLMKRKESGLASAKQVQVLLASGVPATIAREMSNEAAREAITELDAIKPKTQARLFV